MFKLKHNLFGHAIFKPLAQSRFKMTAIARKEDSFSVSLAPILADEQDINRESDKDHEKNC
jgi:hypothetical protein